MFNPGAFDEPCDGDVPVGQSGDIGDRISAGNAAEAFNHAISNMRVACSSDVALDLVSKFVANALFRESDGICPPLC